MVSSPTRSNRVGLSATVLSFPSMALWEQKPTSAISSRGFLLSGRTTTLLFSSSSRHSTLPVRGGSLLESVSEEVEGTKVIPWGFMSWNQAMILPRRLAFDAIAEDEDGSWLPHVVESVVSVEEENRPVEELRGRRWLSQSWTEMETPVAAEYWLLILPSLAKLSPSSSSSELLKEALGRTSTSRALCSSLEGREVPIAPSEDSLARTSWLYTLPAIPESCRDSWIASRMLGSSSSKEPRPCKKEQDTQRQSHQPNTRYLVTRHQPLSD